jgi:hypothetical protein
MAYTVKDLFDTGLLPPADTALPAEASSLFNYLVARLTNSFDEDDVNQYLSWIQMSDHDTLIAHGLAWHEIIEEWPKIKGDLDAGTPSPLGLVHGQEPPTIGFFTGMQDLGQCHQVLAWGYDLDGSMLTIHIYDPDFIGDQNTITLDIGNPGHTTPISVSNWPAGFYRGFFRTHYAYHDPRTPVSAAFIVTVVTSPGITSAGPIPSKLAWRWGDQGTPAPGVGVSAAVGVLTVRDAPNASQRPYAFVRGSDGNLWANWWDGQAWQWKNHGTPPGPGVLAAVGVVTVMDAPNASQRPYVFVQGSDGNLWLNWWDGKAFQWRNQGTPPGPGVSAAVGVVTVMDAPNAAQRPYAFVRGSDGHLWLNWWDGQAWQWGDQGMPHLVPLPVDFGVSAGVGVLTVMDAPNAAQRPHAFVLDSVGNLWVNWWG